MRDGTAFFNGSFATSNTFKQAHAPLQRLICCDINEICTWYAVLRNQDWLTVTFQFGQQFRCLAFQSGNQFGTHESDTKVSLWRMQAEDGTREDFSHSMKKALRVKSL